MSEKRSLWSKRVLGINWMCWVITAAMILGFIFGS